MKNYLFFFVVFSFCFSIRETTAQILPPLEDGEFLENRFLAQCGMVHNTTVKFVFLFRGKEGRGDRIYLLKKDNSIEEIKIPDILIDCHLVLVNSGPKYFQIQTMDDDKKDFFYYFEGDRSGFLTKFAEKKIRGHDGDNKIHHD